MNSTERLFADQSICTLFDQQAEATPSGLAVVDEDLQLSYAQLNLTANRIARAILQMDESSAAPVALLLGQSTLAVGAMLGVLKTGRFYTRLDPAIPVARTAQMLEDSEAKLLVTERRNEPLARRLARHNLKILCCDEIAPQIAGHNLQLHIAPETPALILYTSGSTGRPKGVLHDHRSILVEIGNYVRDTRPAPGDAMSLCTSMSFAMSVRNLYAALLTGATLFPYDLARRGFGGFADWIQRNRITILYMPPTAFRSFCDCLPCDAYFPSIRVLRIAGEPISGEEVRRHRHHFRPDCMLYHGLGPTEAFTVARSWMTLGSCDVVGKMPIGEPLPDKDVLLLDDAGYPVATGSIGHIVVRSKYLARGYWRNADLTGKAFVSDPSGGGERLYKTGDLGMRLACGKLMHMGRRDTQVKIRGHRIEVAEIELALRGLDAVKTAVVEARQREDGEKALVAYVVPAEGASCSVSSLRDGLSQTLPDYMIPSAFVRIDKLPSLPNGKVDRHALPPPPAMRPALNAPFTPSRTPTEARIAGIWAEILSLAEIGADDPFLELGGDSLQAARILARMQEAFEVQLPLVSLFEMATVANLAKEIDRLRLKTATARDPLTGSGHRSNVDRASRS